MTETDEMTITSEYADFQPVYKQDDYTLASESSVASETSPTKKKQRNYMDAYLLNDKSYHKMRRTGGSSDGVYSTNTTPGSSIRDAITGGTSPMCRVGSIYEDLFFKVCFATGEFGSEPKTMFFDCPEQYERHLNASVAQSNKDRWTSKFAAARKLLESEQ
jgi:hypothetical protein